MNSNRQIPGNESQSGEPLQLVGFRVGDEDFGIDILRVHEIIRVQQLTRVPHSPQPVDGVMNLRGRIIPVIALRKRFGLDPAPLGAETRIMVAEIRGSVIGFIVDSVSEVLRIPAESMQAPPRLTQVEKPYVSGVGKLNDRLVLVLDADRLIDEDEPRAAAASA